MRYTTADEIRAYTVGRYPESMRSPLAQATHATGGDSERLASLLDMADQAEACLSARDDWDVESLSHNISSAAGPDVSDDECDALAAGALDRFAAR